MLISYVTNRLNNKNDAENISSETGFLADTMLEVSKTLKLTADYCINFNKKLKREYLETGLFFGGITLLFLKQHKILRNIQLKNPEGLERHT